MQRQALLCCKSPLEGRLYMLWIMAIPFTDVASIVATIACNLSLKTILLLKIDSEAPQEVVM